MSDVEVVPLSRGLVPAYQAFAARAFGPRSYQTRAGYLRWLYELAPEPRGLGACAVATARDEVVGCFHALHLPWTINGATRSVCAPHNLMVAPEHRTGVGFALIMELLKSSSDHLLIGAGDAVRPIYERLGARPLASHWLQTVVNPLSVPIARLVDRGGRLERWLDRARQLASKLRVGGLELHATCDDEQCAALATRLNADTSHAHVRWSAELVHWRFFHAKGPRHLLIVHEDAVLLVSLGVRGSWIVARTVAQRGVGVLLLVAARALLGLLGVNAWLSMTTNATEAATLRRAGFWPMRRPPEVFELHRPRSTRFPSVSLTGAGDYGFEALPP